MVRAIEDFLGLPVVEWLARILLTFPFWGSGLAKLIDFQGGTAEMAQFGLQPAALVNAAVILTQLGGAALIILNRWTWLGAGALGVFTALTIPLVHHFWALEGERAIIAFHTAGEHVGMIGALIVVSILSERRRRSERGGLAFRGAAAE
ncbi:DoxX family protein [Teichococcus cervicalis]|uniref:DoxX family protein n=1 Tax=Pseudoroseomonas cervicalis ATCC 49957 TaxID=525371 RepID=D5RL81_9PROT|nr:DoxX family protein [Pseudoroseomonas cervicalis]EFH11931.1 DoxX family protein [Pseudoroseomonas cervicalis ATCC 49957]